ncbi:MAG: hypothetical protein LC749_08295 [Actinobacteria bacterium]|nr:hypothetical protein [Actinomycetota bacterium]
MELTAQRGLPLLLGMHASDAEKGALIGHYNRSASGPSQVGHTAALAYVADNQRDATATMRTCLPRWLRFLADLRALFTTDGMNLPV